MKSSPKHITVCICTYKRPDSIARLLREVDQQNTRQLFTYSIVVADNDVMESAKPVVAQFSKTACTETIYCVEPRQNIALARNKAIEYAKGDFVAFIDDDEIPTKNWLIELYNACIKYKADGALGPVLPVFKEAPPKWIIKGRFYNRPRYQTGLVIDWMKGRTGNVLLNRQLFNGLEQAFRPEYVSGEDQDFFKRMIEKGHVFVWCNEAIAYEVEPPFRWKRSFMIKKALLQGRISVRHDGYGAWDTSKSVAAIAGYAVMLPILSLIGQHIFVKYLAKMFYHLGRILVVFRIISMDEKYITE